MDAITRNTGSSFWLRRIVPCRGEYEGARLLDMAPTLLDLAGYEIPGAMQGKSLVAGMEKKMSDGGTDADEAAKLIHDRLAGLGYI